MIPLNIFKVVLQIFVFVLSNRESSFHLFRYDTSVFKSFRSLTLISGIRALNVLENQHYLRSILEEIAPKGELVLMVILKQSLKLLLFKMPIVGEDFKQTHIFCLISHCKATLIYPVNAQIALYMTHTYIHTSSCQKYSTTPVTLGFYISGQAAKSNIFNVRLTEPNKNIYLYLDLWH